MQYAGVQEFMDCDKLVKGTSAYTQLKEAHDMIMFSSTLLFHIYISGWEGNFYSFFLEPFM
jgi:hypothetical protein